MLLILICSTPRDVASWMSPGPYAGSAIPIRSKACKAAIVISQLIKHTLLGVRRRQVVCSQGTT